MPRRQPTQVNAVPARRRVRTGCKTCRVRKIKCDERKPTCINCSKRGLVCDNEVHLKWEQEFTSRGLAFGRQGRWHKRAPPSPSDLLAAPVEWCLLPSVKSHHFINSSIEDYRWDDDELLWVDRGGAVADAQSDCTSLALGPPVTDRSTPNPGLQHSPTSYPGLASIDFDLVQYYVVRLCPLTTSSIHTPSPFAQYIVPLFSLPGHEDILHAVLALSACHRSTTQPAWSKTAMALKDGVLASLRRRLILAETQARWDPQILAIMMFLCLYEIVDNCDYRWVIHLKASQNVIRRSRQLGPPATGRALGALAVFTERFFAFQDLVSRSACGSPPLFGLEYWDDAEKQSSMVVDSWMGCSPGLARIFGRITELNHLRAVDAISTDDIEIEAADLEQELDFMSQGTSLGDNILASAVELKRKAILLYHACVLYDAGPSTTLVRQITREILERLCELVKAGCHSGLIFPIFVAAVELDSIDGQLFHSIDTGETVSGRRLVLELLEAIAKGSLANVPRTRAVIQKVWRMRDLSIGEETQPCPERGSSQTNDWTIFVSPYTANISLA